MKYSTVSLALAAGAYAQGATEGTGNVLERGPKSSANADAFSFQTFDKGTSKDGYVIDCDGSTKYPKFWISSGVLLDAFGRTGSIVDNFQYQFDGPPQATAIYTRGWSIQGTKLALGTQTTFYNCQSGSFNNIYDRDQAEQCKPVEIVTYTCRDAANQAAPNQVKPGDPDVPPTPLESASVNLKSGSASTAAGSTAAASTEAASTPSTPSSAPSSMAPMNPMDSMPTGVIPHAASTPSTPDTTTAAAPIVNATNPIATGTAAVPPSPTGATSAPSPFTGAGSFVAAGQKVVLAIAGVAAFALF